MKRRPRKTQTTKSPGNTAGELVPSAPRQPGRRRWWMRPVAATLVPLFLLGVLELGLRLAGFGYPTQLFLSRTIGGEKFLIPNDKFTHRFFPPALARAPLSGRMNAEKPEGTYRIFLLGESAAYGDPDPSFGVGRYLEALLEARYPATDFEVVCVAITAINSHVILPIARECAKRDGDMWVVYMGNNEMVGPFGAGTVFGEKAPRLGFVRSVLALKTTRVGQLIDQLVTGIRGGSGAPDAWAGIDMFSRNPLRHAREMELRPVLRADRATRRGRRAGQTDLRATPGYHVAALFHRLRVGPTWGPPRGCRPLATRTPDLSGSLRISRRRKRNSTASGTAILPR